MQHKYPGFSSTHHQIVASASVVDHIAWSLRIVHYDFMLLCFYFLCLFTYPASPCKQEHCMPPTFPHTSLSTVHLYPCSFLCLQTCTASLHLPSLPASSVVKNLCSHCCDPGLIPGQASSLLCFHHPKILTPLPSLKINNKFFCVHSTPESVFCI